MSIPNVRKGSRRNANAVAADRGAALLTQVFANIDTGKVSAPDLVLR